MRSLLLLALAASLVGCVGLEELYRQADRFPTDRRYDERGYDNRGVDRYVREVDRAVRLDRRQEERVRDVLYDRSYRFEDRYRRSRVESPFPRRARASREVDRFWNDTDRAIERQLRGRQRREYRRFTQRFERDRDRRYDRRDRRGDDDDDDWDDDDD
ncbi:hypothetical protein [Rubrivirga sp.]|uniref:hypothetical protein n=1 Tax=Rubrivirga sp. TaxID=1885344 RepID=UPI003C774BC3